MIFSCDDRLALKCISLLHLIVPGESKNSHTHFVSRTFYTVDPWFLSILMNGSLTLRLVSLMQSFGITNKEYEHGLHVLLQLLDCILNFYIFHQDN